MHPTTFSASLAVAAALAGAADADPWPRHAVDDSSRGADGVRLADVNGDGLPDIATGWEQGAVTRAYLHPGPAKVRQPWPAVSVGKTRSVEDAVFADLDGDGALDVVSCCEGNERAVYVHWAPRDRSRFLNPAAWEQEVLPASRDRMMWMYALPIQVDARHGIDLVAAGKGPGAQIGWFAAPADGRTLKGYAWHPISEAGWVMSLIAEDMDGDGDLDVVTSDRKGELRACRWLENPGPGPEQAKPWKSHVMGGEKQEVMFMALADIDGDGLQDAAAAVKPAEVLFLRRLDRSGLKWEPHTIPYPPNTGGAKAVAVGDIDGDGRADLVLSCEGASGGRSGLVWMRAAGKLPGAAWEAHDVSGPAGIKFDRIELLDLDADGDLDVLTCEESEGGKGLGVIWYENPRK